MAAAATTGSAAVTRLAASPRLILRGNRLRVKLDQRQDQVRDRGRAGEQAKRLVLRDPEPPQSPERGIAALRQLRGRSVLRVLRRDQPLHHRHAVAWVAQGCSCGPPSRAKWRFVACAAKVRVSGFTAGFARMQGERLTGATRLELATSGVTGRRSNQLSYAPGEPTGVPARYA